MRQVTDRLRAVLPGPEIAIGYPLRKPPWGGSNQFLLALRNELRRRGHTTEASGVGRRTRACLLNSFTFDPQRLRGTLRPEIRVVHRVDGPVDVYRGRDEGVDRRVYEFNREFADVTVFQSRYSLEAHEELGLEFKQPFVIGNAVDPQIFYAPQSHPPIARRKARLITTSWSDNPNKGGETYRWLDEHLDGDRYEYTFVGRPEFPFRRARVVPPARSTGVAELLRSHDIFVTASKFESCSNAIIEALACGLPVVYIDSGSNGELVGDAGMAFELAAEIPDLLDRVVDNIEDLRAAISTPTLAQITDEYLRLMGL